MYELKDRIIIVTGAAGGMGADLCRRLAQEGAHLALCGRSQEKLMQLAEELPQDTLVAALDVANERQVADFFGQIQERFGGADALINLAGRSIPGQIAEMDEASYDQMLDTNVKGTFLCSKHFIPLARENAQIINVASMAAIRANGTAPVYCTSKAAVNMFSQGLAIQLAPRGIRVTTVNPAGTDTPFWGSRPVVRERLLKAQDVTETLLFVLKAAPHVVFSQINLESFNAMK